MHEDREVDWNNFLPTQIILPVKQKDIYRHSRSVTGASMKKTKARELSKAAKDMFLKILNMRFILEIYSID